MKWPRIRSRRTTAVSPWMSIVAREVEFSRGETPQIYHAVEQADYISIVALTPRRKDSDRAAVPAGARGLLLGAAGGPASIPAKVRPTRVAASCSKRPD